jgi:tetratricopeptide (TPR) repeat protein
MARSLKTRQYTVYGILLGIAVFLALAVYPRVKPQWVDFRRGERLFLAQRFSLAIPFFQKALTEGLKRPEALKHLGDAYLATGQFQAALPVFQRLVQERPDDMGARLGLVGLYDQFGQVDEALALLEQRPKLWAHDPLVMVRVADLYRRRKEFAVAEKYYERAMGLVPGDVPIQLKLAEMLGWMGQTDKGIALCRQILAKDPRNRAARLQLARLLSWQGRMEEAVKEYRTILGEGP